MTNKNLPSIQPDPCFPLGIKIYDKLKENLKFLTNCEMACYNVNTFGGCPHDPAQRAKN